MKNILNLFSKILLQMNDCVWIEPQSIRIVYTDFTVNGSAEIHFVLDAREGITHLCELKLICFPASIDCKISAGNSFFIIEDVSQIEPEIWFNGLLRLISGLDKYYDRRMSLTKFLNNQIANKSIVAEQQLNIAVQTLKDIVNPIDKIKRGLKEDEQINGKMANDLSNSHHYLKSLATEALKSIETKSAWGITQ